MQTSMIMYTALFILFVFFITSITYPFFISFLKNKLPEQAERKIGPDQSEKKKTPVMGGLLFVVFSIIAYIYSGLIINGSLKISLPLAFALFAGVGFIDDYRKIFIGDGTKIEKGGAGISAGRKLLLEIAAAFVSLQVFYYFDLNDPNFWGIKNVFISILVLMVLGIIWLVGWSNATNITDGIDGLLTGLATISFAGFAYIASQSNQVDVLLFDLAVIGSLLSFMVFNKPKAKIFMGDTGSLALGAGLAMNSILLNTYWPLLIIGLVFAIETATVILQVLWFRTTGKRLFPITPIHHTFQKMGWSEIKIDLFAWTLNILLVVLTIYLLTVTNFFGV